MREILSHSKLDLPFSDFDGRMIHKIQEYEVKKKAAEKNKFYSYICFLAGIILGTLLNYLMSQNLNELVPSGASQDKIVSVIQLLYVVLIVLFADKLWKLSKMDLKKLFR
ncbi:hypothetical protein [Sphingobacterium bovistauri]|uniref:Uncharacterized protein n=1 Tax=Sphingobacterium bovistauri TaxID=2781959 RepID=A0ABS7Z0R6_9SPHI|nr:hypothetical protein [Sphingobacterium bovistauri]MCA5003750.1 hypothetical protein [Sphingobacterium bovistauri]